MSTTSPVVGVLAVQGDVGAHARALTAAGALPRRVRRPEDLAGLSGLVLPGGESTTMDTLLRRYDLVDPLRQLLDDGTPVLGTCAGMVLLAERLLDGSPGQRTLGRLDVTVRRNAFGRQLDSFETDVTVTGLEDPFPAVFIRAPWVEGLGPRAVTLATVGDGRGGRRVVAVQQGSVLATSFHPELTADHRVHGLLVDLARG
ncbi:pyridoxal 5'-phosphate synthase glutaminase subunit PdxT [Auraticoccus monumenti]|uniref:Pyridoxal 5'-phosphate synthase subunit PdxT n=1 Tax=Auraticoccus monumenti TaxID=675864 RepID=A0A1G6S096_9ACTN|nr:pyridoxal 5'-phosphate synthase glutaminase subunit PdxT [Auraticoccus monumenti]SDD10093.1 pyridoxal phosphate synthase yaaE subunit [Auraticoccus monumenti]